MRIWFIKKIKSIIEGAIPIAGLILFLFLPYIYQICGIIPNSPVGFFLPIAMLLVILISIYKVGEKRKTKPSKQ